MLTKLANQLNSLINGFYQHAHFCLTVILILLAVQVINALSQYRLNALGVYPRTTRGFFGIVFMPWLHGSFAHLIFNAIPLFIMMNMLLMNGLGHFFEVTLFMVFLSGFLLWLMGRKALHVGASGVVMGYWGYLMTNAYTHFSLATIILAIICLYYFGNMLIHVVPTDDSSSWEGHLFGCLAGIVAAIILLP